MIEYGFNKTSLGKSILGACFVNDLGNSISLSKAIIGFMLEGAAFSQRTLSLKAISKGHS
jgi:hypothetical protein